MGHVRTVSVVVNTYNYAQFLAEAVDSALSQTYPHTEVVVVDDGSTDGSREVIAGYGGRVTAVLKENGGQASAFNAACRVLRGDVVVFLDADDVLLPTAVEAALPCFDDPHVANAHWPLWLIDQHGHRTGGLLPDRPLAAGDLQDVVIRDGPDSYQGVPTSGNAWSRAFLGAVLPAPEAEYRHGADGYLITLAPLFGAIRTVPEPQGCYRVHGGNQYWSGATDQRTHGSLERYERRSRTLHEYLGRTGVACDPEVWKQRNEYYQWMRRFHGAAEDLRAVIPAGTTFILADENQWGESVVTGRRAIPFLEHQGQYWGPPPDDETAIREFSRLRGQGAGFMVFGWPAFWWLDHYADFRRYLSANFPCVLGGSDLVVFDIRTGGEPCPSRA